MEKNKKIFRLILLYVLIYLVCSLLFVLLMHIPFRRTFMSILMYKGTVFIFLTGLLAGGCMLLAKNTWKGLEIVWKDVILMFCGFCCLNMVLFTLIPVTVERSVSVFMLSYMEAVDDAFSEEGIKEVFVEKYVEEYGAFQKRFHEQLVSGNIKETQEGYRITGRGRFIVGMFRVVATLFDTDKKLVYPQEDYADEEGF